MPEMEKAVFMTSDQSGASTGYKTPRQWTLMQRGSLILLVLQNSALVMVMHYSRTASTNSGPRYLPSTAVLLVEIIKLTSSFALVIWDIRRSRRPSSVSEFASVLRSSIFSTGSWKLIVPAALYTLQNSLVYVAVSNLEELTFQVTYQLKILTTVLFSILLLGKNISSRQWFALVLLTVGVAIVQIPSPFSTLSMAPRMSPEYLRTWATSLLQPRESVPQARRGLVAVAAAALISGLTCVYYEKLVKNSKATVSLWTTNVQLSFFSLFPAFFIGVVLQDGEAIARDGFFHGYNAYAWTTIALQAIGGLIVAACIAYTDNVAKNFAASLSIVLSCAAGTIVFHRPLRVHSLAGSAVVILAMYIYNSRSTSAAEAVLPVGRGKIGS